MKCMSYSHVIDMPIETMFQQHLGFNYFTHAPVDHILNCDDAKIIMGKLSYRKNGNPKELRVPQC